ncbi:MAG: lysine--tRNA ligase [Rhodospirillaceae bacterium]|nr:lysine--tRNA ligase [Rhodospirillaceae bacterium]
MPYTPENVTPQMRELARHSNAWPFVEARALEKRLGGEGKAQLPQKGYVLFETGYGPSGLPHIGTFGEVARTTMVRHAFEVLTGLPTKLFAFSDDMDGMRKVPDNIPNQDMVKQHLGKPLTQVPDPFGTHESFGHHNNARLRSFLDEFGFDYEFKSATDEYKSGRLDDGLLKVLKHYDKIKEIILPTLGPERRATYSPFLPLCPETGVVLQVPIIAHDENAGTVTYENETGKKIEVPVTGGNCKLQWKVDWSMRWMALEVDYEMSGKDHIENVRLGERVCRTLGGNPPLTLIYELFLDDQGKKISKSKGNGLAVEEWLRYATPESLALFMYQKPKTAKRLFFDVIPKNVDEYLTFLGKFPEQEEKDQLNNPVWHIHSGNPPAGETPFSFNVLLNLASVCHSEDKAVLWSFITRYRPDLTPEQAPILDKLVTGAINYYQDFIKPNKKFRGPSDVERAALEDLKASLEKMESATSAEDIQTEVYEVGKRHGFENLRDWFKACYEILLGQEQGPRLGSFIALYGMNETITLITRALAGEDLSV